MIISSQHYIDFDTVDEKIAEIENKNTVEIPVVFAGEIDDEKYYIMIDGHHTYQAAKEIGIEIKFDEKERSEYNISKDATLAEVLEQNWLDGDWYDVETGNIAF